MKKAVLIALGLCAAIGAVSIEAVAADAKPIRIGALFSVTGPASFLGAPEEKTVRMLAEKVNAEGGVLGRKVEVIVKDTQGSPEKAVSFAKQLIEEERVLAIIGPSTTGETMQIKGLCEENEMILVSCAAAEAITNPVAKYVFKTPQKDSQAVTWIYNTMKELGISKIAVVTSNDGFGNQGKLQLEALAPEHGIQVVLNEVYDKQATDLTDIITKVKSAAGVQAVVNWSIVPAQSIVAKNMKQIGLDVPLFQSHGFGNPKYVEQAGVAAEGTLFVAGRLLVVDELPDEHPQKALLAAYKKEYEAKYNEPVSTFGGHAYDALMVVCKALDQVGPDRAKLRDAIENMQMTGISGVFKFSKADHNGLQKTAFVMVKIQRGQWVLAK